MNVNTAELKNNLSRYLRRVRDTGETLTICDRNRPIARITPVGGLAEPAKRLAAERQALVSRAKRLGIDLVLPARDTPMREIEIEPEVAADGRTDLATIQHVRGHREY